MSCHKFRRVYCGSCGFHFDVPVPCGNRFCPVCTKSRRARVKEKLKFLVSALPSIPTYSWKHLTLSIKSSNDLRAQIKSLVSSFRRLRQRSIWTNNVNAGAFVIEVTHSDAGWHAHIHAVIYARFIPWFMLHRAWKKVSTGNALYIQRLPKKAIVGYLTKYLTDVKMSKSLIDDAGFALKGFRLYQTFGLASRIIVPPTRTKYVCPECGDTCWYPDIHHTFYLDSDLDYDFPDT